MTVATDQTAKPSDPLASQRADLLSKLADAQAALDQALADLVRSGGDTSLITAQIQSVSGLRSSVEKADAAALRGLDGVVATAVAQSQSIAKDAHGKAAATTAAEAAQALNSAAAASRSALQNAMGSLHNTPLTFASPEDEDEYRRREAERHAYIDAQLAKHTPEGDLNAAGAGIGQMADAKAHGATGLEFQQRVDELMATTEKLREAASASGVSTEEFDRHLRDDLRRIMKSKGISDAEIDAQFAATPDPLAAAKAYLSSDDDLTKWRDATKAIRIGAIEGGSSIIAEPKAEAHPDLTDAMAKLSSAGLALTDHPVTEDFSHGVSAPSQANSTIRKV